MTGRPADGVVALPGAYPLSGRPTRSASTPARPMCDIGRSAARRSRRTDSGADGTHVATLPGTTAVCFCDDVVSRRRRRRQRSVGRTRTLFRRSVGSDAILPLSGRSAQVPESGALLREPGRVVVHCSRCWGSESVPSLGGRDECSESIEKGGDQSPFRVWMCPTRNEDGR